MKLRYEAHECECSDISHTLSQSQFSIPLLQDEEEEEFMIYSIESESINRHDSSQSKRGKLSCWNHHIFVAVAENVKSEQKISSKCATHDVGLAQSGGENATDGREWRAIKKIKPASSRWRHFTSHKFLCLKRVLLWDFSSFILLFCSALLSRYVRRMKHSKLRVLQCSTSIQRNAQDIRALK